jgi:metallo-beta-lactamase family protein
VVKLQFLGAAGTVTGSRFLVEHDGRRLLVDCGLFQGLKELRLRNRAPFPVPVDSLDAVLLTHAHIDHTGYLPVLVRDGLSARVWCTPPTRDLCALLLPDSGWLQEEEAAHANRHGYSRHRPALPLYTREDGERAAGRLETVPFGEAWEPAPGFSARFGHAGHILGAAWIEVSAGGHTVVFSGDVGRPGHPVLYDPEPPPPCDALVLESTYGNRTHPAADPGDELGGVIRETAARGGVVLIPAFAVGRAQTLLYLIDRLRETGRIPALPVFLDSPMASDATDLLARHEREHRLDAEAVAALRRNTTVTRSVDASKAINARRGPMIIVSASGMATGGRVLHHLKVYAPDHRNTILFVGHQAAGTRGAAMLGGAEAVKIHGGWVPVRAEVRVLDGLSAHADADELIAWITRLPHPPRRVWLTHGEPVAADALRRRIEQRLGWTVAVPEHLGRGTVP